MIQIGNKFNLGETVYFLNNMKKAQRGDVTGISVFLHKDGSVNIYYSIEGYSIAVGEGEIFRTYDALMFYIKEDIADLIEFV